MLTVTKNILREHMFILVSRPPCGLFCLLLLFFTRLVGLEFQGFVAIIKARDSLLKIEKRYPQDGFVDEDTCHQV